METFRCFPLSGSKGNEISGEIKGDFIHVTWGKTSLQFPRFLLDDIYEKFFETADWYPLGSNQIYPAKKGGLGEYIQLRQNVWEQHSPRFASMIAAIMVHFGKIEFKMNKNAIELRKKY
jgi:hypothetical protein